MQQFNPGHMVSEKWQERNSFAIAIFVPCKDQNNLYGPPQNR